MKKKLVLITLTVITLLALVFGGCGGSDSISGGSDTIRGDTRNRDSGIWWIEISPITERYYEIYHNTAYGYAMSEVTEEEYLKYLDMIQEK